MNPFLPEYLKSGLSRIVVIERKVRPDIYGHDELCEEKIAARKGNGFVLATFFARQRFLHPTSYDEPSSGTEPITEARYKSLAKGKRRIDTAKAIRDLESRKRREKK